VTPYAWRQIIVRAVRNPDGSMLACLVAHLVACERAGEILHALGCEPGQPMDVMLKQVLHPKEPQ